jgi:RP/EB family microtubule-associated protein
MSTPTIPQRKANNVSVTSATVDKLSRYDYINWLNQLLDASYTDAKELGTGEGYCQIVHRLYPDSIQLKKVKWSSRKPMDWNDNMKLMCAALSKLSVDKFVPCEKLMACKTMDNFEMLQWFYKFYMANAMHAPQEYNALAARGGVAIPQKLSSQIALAQPAKMNPKLSPCPKSSPRYSRPQVSPRTKAAACVPGDDEVKQAMIELEKDLRIVDADRMAYYGQLQEINTLCKEAGDDDNATVKVKDIRDILYGREATARQEETMLESATAKCTADMECNGNEANHQLVM